MTDIKVYNIIAINFRQSGRDTLKKLLLSKVSPNFKLYFFDSDKESLDDVTEFDCILINLVNIKEDFFSNLTEYLTRISTIVFEKITSQKNQEKYIKVGVQDYMAIDSLTESNDFLCDRILNSIYRVHLLSVLDSENKEFSKALVSVRKGAVDSLLSQSATDNRLIKIEDAENVAKNQRMLKKLERLANIDHLTQKPNRLYFDGALKKHFKRASRHGMQFALLLVDIDHFKTTNDTLGHMIGDSLLKAVANRISSCIRQEDILARIGGDEFAIILDQIKNFKDAGVVANKLLQVSKDPFKLDQKEIFITLSIGVACYPSAAENVESLMKNVDIALYRAKHSGRNTYQYYQEELDIMQKRALKIDGSLVSAVKNHELYLLYQPIICLKTGKVKCFEALIRWKHPVLGELQPDEFIQVAELSTKITLITDWVLEAVCKQLILWKKQNKKVYPIAINLSALDIWHRSFVKKVESFIKRYKIESQLIYFEITESTLMHNTELAISELEQLSCIGYQIAIDDFGTGFSSFGRLHKLPVSTIKIDRSFIDNIVGEKHSMNIVTAMISLFKQLNFEIVAEGIETKDQLKVLIEKGCTYGQGYYFCKPTTIKSLESKYSK